MDLELENNELNVEIESASNNFSLETENTDVQVESNSEVEVSVGSEEKGFKIGTPEVKISGTSMTEIELSTDMTNPTEIMNLINKSGTYVAKNLGVIGNLAQPFAILAKGQFINISNLQEYVKAFGIEIPDNQNIIDIDGRLIDGTHATFRISGGTDLKQLIWLNSENVNDYVKVNFNPTDFVNQDYGIRFYNNKLAIYSATLTDIDNGVNIYKPITSNNIAYAVQAKGSVYFVKKTDFDTLQNKVETLETDLTTLKTEIETILESVVTVDE